MRYRPSALIWRYYTDECIQTYTHFDPHVNRRAQDCLSSCVPEENMPITTGVLQETSLLSLYANFKHVSYKHLPIKK